MRPGTEPVAAIVALGTACALARQALADGANHDMAARRDAFETWLLATFPRAIIAGHAQPRLPNTTLALFPGIETEPLLALLDMNGIACSSGSACASGAHEPSHVLRAMGLGDPGHGILRISASRSTPDEAYTALRQALITALDYLTARREP